MNKRIAKKLRKEMLSWTATSKVRHRLSSFRKAWAIEIEAACRGERWTQPKHWKHWQEMYRELEPELKLKEEQFNDGDIVGTHETIMNWLNKIKETL